MVELRQVSYQDGQGRYWARLIPATESDSAGAVGIPIGPPPLDELGLPDETATRLHNELYNRGVLTEAVARAHRADIAQALMAALKIDVDRIVTLYSGELNNGQA